MTKTQIIIKNIAIAFAIFLIVTIISGILTASYTLFNSLGLINTNNNIMDDLKTISDEVTEVSSLKIDLKSTNLYIKVGDSFKVETNNSKVSFDNYSGNIKIKEESKNWLNNKNMESALIVYIPNIIIDKINIDTGAGKIHIEQLNTKTLYLELGAGEVYIENAIVTDKANIEGGVGKTELNKCELNNLNANLGVGEFKFNGVLTGKNKIDSGIGATSLDLTGTKEEYTINASKGLGNITLNGQKMESDNIYGDGENYLDIDGGIGEIKIKFSN